MRYPFMDKTYLKLLSKVIIIAFTSVLCLILTKNKVFAARPLLYYGVDNVSNVSDFDTLKQYGVNLAQVIVQESNLTKLNSYIEKAEAVDMHLIVWPIGPHFCGANCIPWNYSGGGWVIDEAVKPLLNRLKDWQQNGKGAELLVGINVFQEPRNDGITIEQQVALVNKIKSEYSLPIAEWIDNVVDTGVPTHDQWVSKGVNAIDWPITWTHCMPYYKGSGSNTCQELTCELANPSNPSCCQDQWASSCSQKCYGPEGTCGYGLEKMKKDRAIVGEAGYYGVLLQAFEMPSYNNAHLPTADQMYEEACRVAKSGVVDMIIWYDWDKSYSGYSKDLHSSRTDQYGGDRWAAMKKIYDECAIKSGTASPSPLHCQPLGDVNCSGKVNLIDAGYLILKWGTTDPKANLDDTGQVDKDDLVILLNKYLN